MKVLVACEESQIICSAFREKGYEAYSCDLKQPSGKLPEYHIQDDAIKIAYDKSMKWDMMIAHPPCTYLTITGACWFNKKKYRWKAIKRNILRNHAIDFFMKLYNAPINKICIENPVGFINPIIPHSQIIQPWQFGDSYQKQTCLWLKNLPLLRHFEQDGLFGDKKTHVDKGEFIYWQDKKTGKTKRQALWYANARQLENGLRAEIRSKTFPGIANAMASQWG